jgi:oxygen-independent coproporphyrinogen-3 oxidase
VASPELEEQGVEAVRFETPDSLEGYSAAAQQLEPIAERERQLGASRTLVDSQAALEESLFLGLRMNRGISLAEITDRFGAEAMRQVAVAVDDLVEAALLDVDRDQVRLTSRGRLLSNEVFAQFLRDKPTHHR